MAANSSNNTRLFIGFLILQIFLGSMVDLGPLLFIAVYPLFILTLPVNTTVNKLYLWGFFIGLAVDFFSDSILGLNAVATLIMTAAQPSLFKFICRKGDLENQIRPGLRELGLARFTGFVAIALTMHHIAFSVAESFDLMLFIYILPRVLISIVVNTALILLIEYGVFYRRYR